MERSIIGRFISILTEVEQENMYEELATLLGKTDMQSENTEEAVKVKDFLEVKADLGVECKKKREKLGLTVYAVAKASGILQNQVKAIEDGQGYNIDALLKLISAIKLDINLVDNMN